MERPFGVKIAVGIHVFILVFMAASFYFLQGDLEKAKGLGREVAAGGGEAFDQEFYDIVGLLINAMLVFGLLNAVPAYLLWQGNNAGRYTSSVIAFLCGLLVWVILILYLPLIYLIWFHRKTKEFYSIKSKHL
jgi:hypothetical protein